jgi:hypothetical protein
MFHFPKHMSLLALLNSPYLPVLLTNFCALCLFQCCHITVVCRTSCRLQWHVDRLYLLPQIEATEMVLARSAAAIKILLVVYFLFFYGGWTMSHATAAPIGPIILPPDDT